MPPRDAALPFGAGARIAASSPRFDTSWLRLRESPRSRSDRECPMINRSTLAHAGRVQ